MVRYDAAVIGAGADGLAAAAQLARAGLKTIVLERAGRVGGRLSTLEFHPGFRASPFADTVAPIPPAIFWSLDLVRHGALLLGDGGTPPTTALRSEILARALAAGDAAPRKSWFSRAEPASSWPGAEWAERSLVDVLESSDPDAMAIALAGRACDPFLAGSALHALAPSGGSGIAMGGMATLAAALERAACAAGAEISCGLEVTDVRRAGGRVSALCLADGSEIETAATISTLDLKRTFLTLFKWNELPKEIVTQVGHWRMGGGTARVLFALDGTLADAPRDPICVSPSPQAFADAHGAWRAGTLADDLPVVLRVTSASDPGLAPQGKAVATATLGAVPFRLFDGGWSREKRDRLCDIALRAADVALPGLRARVTAAHVIAPEDFAEELGLTEGDLWGGEIAPDQMLDLRPGPRTAIPGFYLAGPSAAAAPYGTGAAGFAAARALLADAGPRR